MTKDMPAHDYLIGSSSPYTVNDNNGFGCIFTSEAYVSSSSGYYH